MLCVCAVRVPCCCGERGLVTPLKVAAAPRLPHPHPLHRYRCFVWVWILYVCVYIRQVTGCALEMVVMPVGPMPVGSQGTSERVKVAAAGPSGDQGAFGSPGTVGTEEGDGDADAGTGTVCVHTVCSVSHKT